MADARGRAIRRILWCTLAANVAVAAAKIAVGIIIGSLSLRADGFHSATDGLNNIVLLIGTWLAAAPPDDEHPYGHKKIEVLAAGLVGITLLLVAADVARDVFVRLSGGGSAPRIDALAAVTLGATLVVNVVVWRLELRAGTKLQSPALLSDAAHTQSDIVVTLGVAASVGLVFVGLAWADAVAGVVVAGFIAMTGFRLLKQNAAYLIEARVVDPRRILDIALDVDGVLSVRDVRSHGLPGAIWLDLSIAVDGRLTVELAHTLAHRVEEAIRRKLEGIAGVQVHVEPR